MTELSLKWKQIFDEISTADKHIVGKTNHYNLASILEDLYVENAELKERIEKLESQNKDIQMPNGDFLKNYPEVTRVEVIGKNREYIRYGCSNVQVSLQDDGKTLKVFANYD